MVKIRLIPVLILRDGMVVQSVNFRHTNIIHRDPIFALKFFNRWESDEIIILDVSRDRKNRDKFYNALKELSQECYVPIAAGGWITTVDEARRLLRLGADKVVINTKAFRNPDFIKECSKVFGSQCIVVSIDSKKVQNGEKVYIDRGMEPTMMNTVDWAKKVETLGAGEIFLNSIDHDGSRRGYNLPLIKSVTSKVNIPVIAMGGVAEWQHLVDGVRIGGADAVAAANIFHYSEQSVKKAKKYLKAAGIDVR
jgi:cyclase